MRHLDPLHIKLLLVEDDEDDYFFFEDLLDDFQSIQFDLDWADTYDKGLQAVQRHQHDIYVFDFRLGSRTGLDLLEEVVALGHRIPIILLTGQEDREIDLAAMTAGATDYLVKGTITSALLERSIRYAINHTRTLVALQEREEQYNLVAQASNDGLWDWNLQTHQVYYSPRWAAIIGQAEAALQPSIQEWFDRIHPEDKERFRTDLRRHLRRETTAFECQYRMLHLDQSYRWVSSRGMAVFGPHNRVVRMAGSHTDLTNHVALYDHLTELPSRALFLDQLHRTLTRVNRQTNYLFAVLFLDCDRFKVINDSLGHAIGDQLLIEVAKRLTAALRPGDVIARLGGDEFAILLENIAGQDQAEQVASRLNRELEKAFELQGHTVYISASIGIALNSDHSPQAENLLRDADNAMYRAKALGKSRYVVFEAAMRDRVQALLRVETDLRAAIANQEFQLYYQPIISLKTHEIVSLEALIRWQHPQRGLISPQEFIPVAEETGLILAIGQWVLEESCQQLWQWHQTLTEIPPLSISVNLSRKQFSQASLGKQIQSILSETGVSARHLKLEITETMIMENEVMVSELISQLRALGLQLQIDDFGTGYSSLSFLHNFPLDTLKIDRSFIEGLVTDTEKSEIVRTMITLAHNLGMTAIAEGVETQAQLQWLQQHHCDCVQGYLLSKPLSADQMQKALMQSHRVFVQPLETSTVASA
ncbi:bifunctional diguanylate cyclase/phosphodiesterase [Acaryochloris sp. CCMEE 5410]|uniref:putative bifunctional diguanylate cyclase/phosphodiesterase n=1 Tax=Acaryochloris sp. CCMEE 5410 TaxID=310037 RepID=UPI0002483F54|nr:EAL domain-containing protein [Acaryochloris sp. CCMEE 5410]KAI9131445.1 EAL domain-containing protein [Acaryochloris sp. CCMEE 5410]